MQYVYFVNIRYNSLYIIIDDILAEMMVDSRNEVYMNKYDYISFSSLRDFLRQLQLCKF